MLHDLGLTQAIQIDLDAIEVEMGLVKLILEKAKNQPIDSIELRALASTVHSIYNGYENIFQRVAKTTGIKLSSHHKWHKQLLEAMCNVLLDEELYTYLSEILGFRHFYRHAYSYTLSWDHMSDWVVSLPVQHQKLLRQIEEYLKRY